MDAVDALVAGEPGDGGVEVEVDALLPELRLHGLGDDEVLVGGRVDGAIKRAVADRLDAALSIPAAPVSNGDYGGTHPDNFVNWLAADGAGLQVELGETARADESEAVLGVLDEILREKERPPSERSERGGSPRRTE